MGLCCGSSEGDATCRCSWCDGQPVTDSTVPTCHARMDMHALRQRVERARLYILSAQGSPVPSTLLLMEYRLPQRDSDKASLALEEINGQGWESTWEYSEVFLPVSSALQGVHRSAWPQRAP